MINDIGQNQPPTHSITFPASFTDFVANFFGVLDRMPCSGADDHRTHSTAAAPAIMIGEVTTRAAPLPAVLPKAFRSSAKVTPGGPLFAPCSRLCRRASNNGTYRDCHVPFRLTSKLDARADR